ncbi:MAG: hypothetical protein K8W52_24270 [Deltaproteobacteria bacterium]|nr:hypothetical protein [Deltaproteobacteria bacterium]
MVELAYNGNGEPFDVPEQVTHWRVRRMKSRGAPEVVYGHDGLPLTVEVGAALDDLRRAVDAPGRYRLEGVDDDLRIVEDVPVAYVQVMRPIAVEERAPAPRGEESSGVVREAMRLNTELARAVIDRFPEMLQASAELLRAADGAGLPARLPLAPIAIDVEDDDQDEDELAPEVAAPGPFGGIDLNALVAQIVPLIITKAMNGGIDLSNLGALLDWRKAVPKAKPANPAAAPAATPRASSATAPRANEAASPRPAANQNATPTAVPTIEPGAMMHFLAIQKALPAEEAALAKEVAKGLTPAELNAWIGELAPLSVPDAVARIRSIIAKLGPAGAVS